MADLDPMAAIRDTFFEECEEQLAALEGGLLSMQAGDVDSEIVNAVFRAVHSIKGGAGAFGLVSLVRFAHVFENALDSVRAGRLAPEPALLDLMLRSADALSDLVRAARDDTAANTTRNDALVAELAALGEHSEAVAAPQADELDGFDFAPVAFQPIDDGQANEAEWIVRFSPRAALYSKANESAVLLRELGRLGRTDVQLDTGNLPPLADLDPEGAYLTWTIHLTTPNSESEIREVFEFCENDCDLSIIAAGRGKTQEDESKSAELVIADLIRQAHGAAAEHLRSATPEPGAPEREHQLRTDAAIVSDRSASKPPVAAGADATKATIRVDLERVDRLIDLVGELVINQAMLAQRVGEVGLTRSSNVTLGLTDLEQLTREIQDSVMAIRAQPVKSVFQRMPRLVREVAALTGKQVRLVTEGEGTEVDKTVIEHLADPLTHMIRNAIDHGVERPEVRRAAGKPEEGTVRLAALHRSGRIVIVVSDDGAGINRARVRASALAKGLIGSDVSLSDDETDNLIFLPGFSTVETVSDISGRGVGMDVVKRSIQALGGRIAITSQPGRGSTFTMSLPLTLAVLDGMVVSVAGHTLVAPLTAMVETFQPRATAVHSLGSGAMVVAVRGNYIPLIDVGVALGYRSETRDPSLGVALLVEGEGGARAALVVDDIQGQRQVVIKSLEANYRRVPGIAAATILGDGRVALIVDVDAVVAASRTGHLRSELQSEEYLDA